MPELPKDEVKRPEGPPVRSRAPEDIDIDIVLDIVQHHRFNSVQQSWDLDLHTAHPRTISADSDAELNDDELNDGTPPQVYLPGDLN